MSRLREIQRGFCAAVVEGNHRAVAEAILPGGSALRSLALYRRLIRNNYRQVLMVTYPVLHRLVGDRSFSVIARGYIRTHPSTSGDLFPYGRYLPAFLNAVQASPLLVELARLEWACHEVYQAADSPWLSGDQCTAIASADPSRVTVRLHTASRLLSFSMPIHRVWQALRPEAPTDEVVALPLPEEDTSVVVTRGDGSVQVTPLAALDGILLVAMANGKTLVEVERMAIASQPNFDFQRFVATVLPLRVIGGFSVKEPR